MYHYHDHAQRKAATGAAVLASEGRLPDHVTRSAVLSVAELRRLVAHMID